VVFILVVSDHIGIAHISAVMSKLYSRSGWAVSYASWLACKSMDSGDDLSVAVIVFAPIWIGLQLVVTGAFRMIVTVAGGFAAIVGEAVVAVGCTGLFVVAKIESCGSGTAVSVLVPTETVAERLLLASQANTFNFKSLNVSNISLGNRMPSSFGHSRRSQQLCLSSCSRVTVSGSHQCGAVVVVMGF
jgi:hypothetical protein